MTCFKFKSHHWNHINHLLDNINVVYDTSFTATYSLMLVTLNMGLTRSEYKYCACEFIHTYRHISIQALYPILYEEFYHVIIPFNNYMLAFKEFILKDMGEWRDRD